MIQYQFNPIGVKQERGNPVAMKPFTPIDPNIRPEPAGFIQQFSKIFKAWVKK